MPFPLVGDTNRSNVIKKTSAEGILFNREWIFTEDTQKKREKENKHHKFPDRGQMFFRLSQIFWLPHFKATMIIRAFLQMNVSQGWTATYFTGNCLSSKLPQFFSVFNSSSHRTDFK